MGSPVAVPELPLTQLPLQRKRQAVLDVKWLRENREEAERRLATRGEEAPLGAFEELDGKRRKLLRDVEELKELRNRVSDEIGTMKKQGEDAHHGRSASGAKSSATVSRRRTRWMVSPSTMTSAARGRVL